MNKSNKFSAEIGERAAVDFKLDVASTIKFRRLFAPVGGRV